MNPVYHRYFKAPADHPLSVRVFEIVDHNRVIEDKVSEVARSIGAVESFFFQSNGDFAGFRFDPADTSGDFTKPVKRRSNLQNPRRATPRGKEISDRVVAIGRKMLSSEALPIIGLPARQPFGVMMVGMKLYMSTVSYAKDKFVIVSVPWMDIDPEKLAELPDYDPESSCPEKLSFLKWVPPQEFEELKHWQVEKLFEELK